MNIRILICEDDFAEIEKIKDYLKIVPFKYPYCRTTIDVCRSGNELLQHYKDSPNKPYDIIFLDVDLGDTNGVKVALELRKFDRKALIVYITSHLRYITYAQETHMFRYIKKPISREKFEEVFEQLMETIQAKEKFFTYKIRHNLYRVPCKAILYFEISGHRKITIHTANGQKQEFNGKMPNIVEELKNYGFVYAHVAYCVNLAFVREVDNKKSYVVLCGKISVPLSKHRYQQVKEMFLDYVSKEKKV